MLPFFIHFSPKRVQVHREYTWIDAHMSQWIERLSNHHAKQDRKNPFFFSLQKIYLYPKKNICFFFSSQRWQDTKKKRFSEEIADSFKDPRLQRYLHHLFFKKKSPETGNYLTKTNFAEWIAGSGVQNQRMRSKRSSCKNLFKTPQQILPTNFTKSTNSFAFLLIRFLIFYFFSNNRCKYSSVV